MTLKNIPTESLTAIQVSQLKTVQEAIPLPTRETPLQKIIPVEDIERYLSGDFTEVGGFFAQAEHVKGLRSYNDVVEGLRLDYTRPDGKRVFPDDGDSYGVIRFKTSHAHQSVSPYNERFGGKFNDSPPFTGNGFTSSRDGKIIPENSFKPREYHAPQEGDQIYKISNGKEELLGTYDKNKQKFFPEKR